MAWLDNPAAGSGHSGCIKSRVYLKTYRSLALWAGWIPLIGAAYFLTGDLGLRLESVSRLATFVWAPAGIAVAAVVGLGSRAWPAVTIGAFAVNLTHGATIFGAAVIALGNTLQALTALGLLRGLRIRLLPFEHPEAVFRVLFLVVPVAAAVAATFGLLGIQVSGAMGRAGPGTTWLTWWIGDMLGMLIVAPFCLAWLPQLGRRQLPGPAAPQARRAEAVAFAASLILVSWLVFFAEAGSRNPAHTVVFVTFPFIMWAAVRFGAMGITGTHLLISVLAVAGTLSRRGPYGAWPSSESLFYVQTFMAVAAGSGMMMAAFVRERQRAHEDFVAMCALQEFLDNMATFSVKLGLDGRVRLLNKAAKDACIPVSDFSAVSFLDGSWFSFDPLVRMRVKNAFDRACAGEKISYEERLKTADRGIIWVTFSLTPVFDRFGKVRYLVGEGRDISEQKEVERLLRKSEANLVEAQKIAKVGSFEWDSSTNELSWSAEMFRLYGLEPGNRAWTFEDFIERVVPEDRDEVRRRVLESLKTGEPFLFEERIRRPDGAIRLMASDCRVIQKETGPCIVGSCRDITDQRAAERERAELYRRAERARRDAEAANASKDLFLATLSHELRTPLTTILSWAQLLRLKDLPESKVSRGLELIEQSAKAQEQMINDLLDVSRIVMGKVSLNRVSLDPSRLIRDAVEDVKHQASEKGLRLTTLIQPKDVAIEGDRTRMKQILWNLLNNAIRFTPSGGRILVTLDTPLSAEGERVRITVRDTGPGIAPEFLPKIFTSFSQVDATSRRAHGGLGIGLTIVKYLTELQNGKVSARSEGPGKGAVFTVEFPRAEGAALPRAEEVTPSPEAPAPARLDGCRVLLIDDNEFANESVAEVLRAHGAEVRSVLSAREGLEQIERQRPEVVICDIAMPGQDGYDFIRLLRGGPDPESAALPVVALTAYASAKDRSEALSAGFDAYLAKPVGANQLLATVQSARPGTTASQAA